MRLGGPAVRFVFQMEQEHLLAWFCPVFLLP